MDDIKYMLKPDWVSWQDIKECMIKAHDPLRKKGVIMQNQTMTAEEFEMEYKNAFCFVALNGKDVVGTCALKIVKVNRWWHKGDTLYHFGDAIVPEFRGSDVYFGLQKIRSDFEKDTGIRVIYFNTEENNKLVQKLNLKKGAKRVKLFASSKTWYYSVVMARWLDGCPLSDCYCNLRYKLSNFLVKMTWKPGRIIRFIPMRDSDFRKIHDKYQLCSNVMSDEDFCKKLGVDYKKYKSWVNRHIK